MEILFLGTIVPLVKLLFLLIRDEEQYKNFNPYFCLIFNFLSGSFQPE